MPISIRRVRVVFRSTVLACALAFAASAAAKTPPPPQPAAEAIPALAEAFRPQLAARSAAAPDGAVVSIGAILDAHRLEKCLDAVRLAEGYPAAWLVVQDQGRPYDLVFHVVLGTDGKIADPDVLFLTSRREWDDDALEAAVRAATGKRPPRERSRNLVLQSFSKRVVTTYVYDLPATGSGAKGLLAMLPEGSLLRESTVVELGDGHRHTLAVILIHPRFVPSPCRTDAERSIGHEDAGGVLLVLAGEAVLEATLDLTEDLKAGAGEARLPRYACEPDDAAASDDAPIEARFGGRTAVTLLQVSPARAPGGPVTVRVRSGGGAAPLLVRIEGDAKKRRLVRADGS